MELIQDGHIMDTQLIVKHVMNHVLVLQMNDIATRNALSSAMLNGLAHELRNAGPEILAIVIAGSNTCFSSGGDFRELSGTAADFEYDNTVAQLTAAITESDKLVVAAVEGPCMGAAADIALSCDYRVAGAGSFMQIPAVSLGLLYNPASIVRLAGLYRPDSLRRLLLAGERMFDHDARDAGLFSCVVPAGKAQEQAVASLAHMDPAHARAAVLTKQLLLEPGSANIDMDYWQDRRLELLSSDQRREAVRKAHERFLKKPRPD